MAALTLCLAGAALADDLQTVGDPDSLGFSAKRLARITSWFEAQTKKGDPAGFVVGIARGGKLAYLQPTGFEDHDKKIPMRPDSIFRIGSMSKQITSVATMMLVDEGKLELDAPSGAIFAGAQGHAGCQDRFGHRGCNRRWLPPES